MGWLICLALLAFVEAMAIIGLVVNDAHYELSVVKGQSTMTYLNLMQAHADLRKTCQERDESRRQCETANANLAALCDKLRKLGADPFYVEP